MTARQSYQCRLTVSAPTSVGSYDYADASVVLNAHLAGTMAPKSTPVPAPQPQPKPVAVSTHHAVRHHPQTKPPKPFPWWIMLLLAAAAATWHWMRRRRQHRKDEE